MGKGESEIRLPCYKADASTSGSNSSPITDHIILIYKKNIRGGSTTKETSAELWVHECGMSWPKWMCKLWFISRRISNCRIFANCDLCDHLFFFPWPIGLFTSRISGSTSTAAGPFRRRHGLVGSRVGKKYYSPYHPYHLYTHSLVPKEDIADYSFPSRDGSRWRGKRTFTICNGTRTKETSKF